MKEKHSNSYYLDKAPVHKSIMHLSIPMMLGMSAGTLYNLINAFFIGLVHDTGMFSAITLGLPIFTVLMAVGNMFGVGGGTFITRLAAMGEKEKAKRVAGYSFYSSVGIGLLIALIAWLFTSPIVHGLGADQAVYEYTSQYAITLLAGGAIVILNFTLEQLVRSEGASKESMIGMFISIAASIVLDVLFILILNWHVIGAALSIVLANACSAAYYVWFLSRRSENLRGFLGHWKLQVKDQMEVFKIGVSELLQTSFLIVSTLLLNHYAMIYGDGIVAGFGIALRIVQLPEFITMGIFMGIIPLVAHSFASQKFDRLKAAYKQAALYIIGIAVLFIGVVYVFKESIIRLFSTDAAVLEAGGSILVAMLISALFTGLTGLFTGIFKAVGEGIPTNIMAVCQGTLFIPVIIIFHQSFGLTGIIWSMTVTEVITSVLGLILFAYHYKRIDRLQERAAV
ncbi:MATE family efflux transporter [Paenibacillus sp. FSL R7-0652]|uniref:Multidrug export protein MepA n=1 Tax=Paenibacillus sp. AN1007 TaxID=3151385 RepID=A0AAU8N8B8_9BACL